MGSAGLSMGFFLFSFLFDLPRRASNRLEKCSIYCDLMSEAVAMPALVNLFCPPRIIFCVVVYGRVIIGLRGIQGRAFAQNPTVVA